MIGVFDSELTLAVKEYTSLFTYTGIPRLTLLMWGKIKKRQKAKTM